MKKLFPIAISLSITLLLPVTPAMAWEKKSKSKKSTPAAVDTSDKISAVHLASITVSIHSPSASKEYKVTPATKITVNGEPKTLHDLATGMNVSVTLATDPTVAATIDAKSAKRN
ncbi:MAG: hypothetical protein M3R29_04070 [Verrucomicrobiota bacterium]|nr:hypothetical protein [Verrucomicrobiota bacterium]